MIVPPGPGRYWDAHLGLDTPLAPMPDWMVIVEAETPDTAPRPVIKQTISRYAETALDRAVNAIAKAPNGAQRDTLNREVYGIASLVAGGVLPSPLALDALHWAARQMPTYSRPWGNVGKLVNAAFLDGMHHPRRPEGRR